MTPTASDLLALRHRVPDATLIDWLDLAQWVQPPCTISTQLLINHWHCTQPNVSRRLSRLWHAELIDYRAGRGQYIIRRLGPSGTAKPSSRPSSSTPALLINEIYCAATALAR